MNWDQIEELPIESDLIVSNAYPYLQENVVDILNQRSHQRREILEEFRYLDETISSFKSRYDRESIPLGLLDRINLLNADDQLMDELEAHQKELEIYAFEHLPILLKDPEPEPEMADSESEPEVDGPTEAAPLLADHEGVEEAKSEDESDEDDEEEFRFDIHLRESMRIVSDWILLEQHLDSPDERQIALRLDGENHLDQILGSVHPQSVPPHSTQ